MYRKIKLATRSTAPATGALFVCEGDKLSGTYAQMDKAADGAITLALRRPAFSAKAGAVAILYPDRGPTPLILVGLGSRQTLDSNVLRKAGGCLVAAAFKTKTRRLSLVLPPRLGSALPAGAALAALVDGLALGSFDFTGFKGAAHGSQAKPPALDLSLVVDPALRSIAADQLAINQGVATARTLAATPPNVAHPAMIAKHCQALARQTGLTCHILSASQAKQRGMGGLVAVGQGSPTPPRLICLEHKPAQRKRGDKPILLVGKSITFDTGGYSLKPDGGKGMKYDKCGGMAVIGVMHALANLKVKQHVVALLPCAENMIDAHAYRVDDILTLANGVTVEITNTDAEGRLVLADALAYGTEKYQPQAVIDVATLTGGVVVALGDSAAGLFCENVALRKKIESASHVTGEKVWQLPLWDTHRQMMKSSHADLVNSANRKAHPIQGAAFLSYFVGKEAPSKMPSLPWAHLDIAGMASCDRDDSPYVSGPTGYGVRLLAQVIKDWE